MNVRAQQKNFSHMIASPFNSELHFASWESAMRGNNVMMNMLYDKVNNMLVSKNTPDVVDTKKQIVFPKFCKGSVASLDAQEVRYYSLTLIELKTLHSTDGSGSGTMFSTLPYYDKDNAAFMSHKYISHSIWHRAREVLYQALLKFHRQPSGAQLPGYTTIKSFQEGSFDGSKYRVVWEVIIEKRNGRNSSLDYVKVHQDYILLDFDPRKHDSLYSLPQSPGTLQK